MDTATFTTSTLSAGMHPITVSYGGDPNFSGSGAVGSGIVTLASFDSTNGQYPLDSPIEDAAGNLFGTTSYGGPMRDGAVFELPAGSGSIVSLAFFNGTDGSYPVGGLVEDASGDLFGTTQHGGTGWYGYGVESGYGTVFEIKADSDAITALASFNGVDGAYPVAALIQDASGDLFGTAESGGALGDGTVFEVESGTESITTLASLTGEGSGADGDMPEAPLLEDRNGNLFGTTEQGGPNNDAGTVFEISAGSGLVTTLASFNGANGSGPESNLVEDASGDLFGTTYWGGPYGVGGSDGAVFELPAGSGTITALAFFNGTNGFFPYGNLVDDGSGNLFGTTVGAAGTVFEVESGSGAITTLASFNASNRSGTDGAAGGLIEDASGNFFGAGGGGPSNYGTLFEFSLPLEQTVNAVSAATAVNSSLDLANSSHTLTSAAPVAVPPPGSNAAANSAKTSFDGGVSPVVAARVATPHLAALPSAVRRPNGASVGGTDWFPLPAVIGTSLRYVGNSGAAGVLPLAETWGSGTISSAGDYALGFSWTLQKAGGETASDLSEAAPAGLLAGKRGRNGTGQHGRDTRPKRGRVSRTDELLADLRVEDLDRFFAGLLPSHSEVYENGLFPAHASIVFSKRR